MKDFTVTITASQLSELINNAVTTAIRSFREETERRLDILSEETAHLQNAVDLVDVRDKVNEIDRRFTDRLDSITARHESLAADMESSDISRADLSRDDIEEIIEEYLAREVEILDKDDIEEIIEEYIEGNLEISFSL